MPYILQHRRDDLDSKMKDILDTAGNKQHTISYTSLYIYYIKLNKNEL